MRLRIMAILMAACMLVPALCIPVGYAGVGGPALGTSRTNDEAADPELDETWALPYAGEDVTLRVLVWETFLPIDPNTEFGIWHQQQLGNLHIEWEIPSEDTGTLMETYLASGDMPDIMLYRGAKQFADNYNDGSRTLNLYDYAAYMPEYFERREAFPHLSWFDAGDSAGYLFGVCWFDAPSEVWFQNQDLADKYDLAVPANWDDMKANMEAVTAAEPGVDGLLLIPWGFSYQYMCFARLFGVTTGSWSASNMVYDSETDKWSYSLYDQTEIYRAATEAMAEAYANGWINADFVTLDGTVYNNKIHNGEWLYCFEYCNISQAAMDNDFRCAMTFIDPPAAAGVTPSIRTDFTSDNTDWCFVISKDTKYPELAASYLEFIASQAFAETFYWGFEGVTYEVAEDGSRQFLDSWTSMPPEENKATIGIQVSYGVQPFVTQYHASDALVARFAEECQRGLTVAAEKLKSGEYATYYGRNVPLFDDDAKDLINSITGPVGTYVEENLIAFVLGRKPMSEWDAFIDGIADYGDMNRVVELYNSAEQGPVRATQFEREYLHP